MLIGKGGGLRHLDGAHIRVIFADHQNGLTYRGLKALQDVSLKVAAGEIVAVVGANGAGKSTLLKAIAGQVATEGTIRFDGQTLASVPAHRIARMSVGLVPEGRRLFPRLSVEDNLRLGAYARRDADRFAPMELVFSLFPRLSERLTQRAETLSGSEQQMLTIGRALMGRPRLLMLGMTVLLVEQRLAEALEIADRAYVLQTGRVVLSGKAAESQRTPRSAQPISGYETPCVKSLRGSRRHD